MTCAWNALLGILPGWMRSQLDDRDRETLQELRLRINAPPECIGSGGIRRMGREVDRSDLQYCVNAASKYSPWAASTAENGYITAPGGHRIGLCGQAVCTPEQKIRIQELTSVCIRVARDFPGIGEKAALISGSLLILGAPGWGKTTLLRDLCRILSKRETLCVVDSRCELFPPEIPRGERMDVLSGCDKPRGMEMVLRTMGPSYIAADEITSAEDCAAILHAANCGVSLLATAHGTCAQDYLSRPAYRPLAEHRVFPTLLILHPDKSYTVERMNLCISNGSVQY